MIAKQLKYFCSVPLKVQITATINRSGNNLRRNVRHMRSMLPIPISHLTVLISSPCHWSNLKESLKNVQILDVKHLVYCMCFLVTWYSYFSTKQTLSQSLFLWCLTVVNLPGGPSYRANQANPGNLSNPAGRRTNDKHNMWFSVSTPSTTKHTYMEIRTPSKFHYILTPPPKSWQFYE